MTGLVLYMKGSKYSEGVRYDLYNEISRVISRNIFLTVLSIYKILMRQNLNLN